MIVGWSENVIIGLHPTAISKEEYLTCSAGPKINNAFALACNIHGEILLIISFK
jgi:hypothetical protein